MPQFTLDSIDQRVLGRLDNNELLYSVRQRYYAINECLRVLNLFTGFSQDSVDVPGFSVANQLFYRTPPGIILPQSVYFEGKQLQRLSVRAAASRYRTWVTDNTSQQHPVQEWIPCGLGFFAIHPIDTAGGKNITVNGITEPTTLVLPTDTITVDDSWIELVEDLSFQILTIKESTAVFTQASLAYRKFVREIKGFTKFRTVKFGRYYVRVPSPAEGAPEAINVGQ